MVSVSKGVVAKVLPLPKGAVNDGYSNREFEWEVEDFEVQLDGWKAHLDGRFLGSTDGSTFEVLDLSVEVVVDSAGPRWADEDDNPEAFREEAKARVLGSKESFQMLMQALRPVAPELT